MDLNEFIKTYKGKKVDFDGQYGAQCVDLARQYFKDVWEFTRQPEGVVGAKDFYFKHESRPIQRALCECISYKRSPIYEIPVNKPPVGAVLLFDESPTNKYGHICICVEVFEDGINVFEQDGFKQDGAKITKLPFNRLLGWLVKKE